MTIRNPCGPSPLVHSLSKTSWSLALCSKSAWLSSKRRPQKPQCGAPFPLAMSPVASRGRALFEGAARFSFSRNFPRIRRKFALARPFVASVDERAKPQPVRDCLAHDARRLERHEVRGPLHDLEERPRNKAMDFASKLGRGHGVLGAGDHERGDPNALEDGAEVAPRPHRLAGAGAAPR